MHCPFCFLEVNDIIIFFFSCVFAVIWTIAWAGIIYSMKPNLEIVCACITKEKRKKNENEINVLRIKIRNIGNYNSVNLKIEAAVIEKQNTQISTYHLKLEINDFLILPPKNNSDNSHERVFTSVDISENASAYINRFDEALEKIKNGYLRVRVHAEHEFSGLGKAFEKNFDSIFNGC